MSQNIPIVFASLKSCLVNLPQNLSSTLIQRNIPAQNVILQLRSAGKVAYAGWTGHTSADSRSLEMDPAFARVIEFKESDQTIVELKLNPPEATVIWVEPLTADDWEIMELHASFLELNLLNQIRAVSQVHPLTIYLGPHSTATVLIKKIEPELKSLDVFAKISPDAEVIVAPKSRHSSQSSANGKARSITGSRPRSKQVEKKRLVFLRAIVMKTAEKARKGLYALVPSEVLRSDLSLVKYVEIQVIIPPFLQSPQSNPEVGTIDGQSDQLESSQSSQISQAKRITVRAIGDDSVPENHVAIPQKVSEALEITLGSTVRLLPAHAPLKKISKISVHQTSAVDSRPEIRIGGTKDDSKVEACRKSLKELGEGPISHGLRVNDTLIGLGKPGDWCVLPLSENLPIEVGETVLGTQAPSEDSQLIVVKGVNKVVHQSIKVIRRSGGILLYGSRGSGKSSIALHCANVASDYCVHSVRTSCAKLADDRIPSIREAINKWFAEAAWYAPSVLILDDLDRLCPAEVEHADSTRARQIAEIFLSVIRSFIPKHRISLLATSQSKESVHELLVSSHIFNEVIHLGPPNQMARREIAMELFGEAGQDIDWLEVANLTDGYLAGDLQLLTERAKHESLIRQMREPSTCQTIRLIDYAKAIEGFTPASLRGVKLQKSTVQWAEIGGLDNTRRILLETLEWPTKYAPIFANCPLRLRSGLLLYGYPGCGKTLLASAVASQCGLNFISVKGPELLNKYIGASEKSVRDLFDRAQAAKPCILFFDEFDSIAPKRGHDSTGVTDRVVNQMLTQMDGAEGLDGVYVLAATSRPDLIDPALLRPGRLDKSLLCDMPSLRERIDIVHALSTKLHLSDDIDLEALAERTHGYTGADLQAVLYNAHLEAIHHVLDDKDETTHDLDGQRPKIQEEIITFQTFTLAVSQKDQPYTTLAERAAEIARIEAVMRSSKDSLSRTGDSEQEAPIVTIQWEDIMKSLSTTKPSISAKERTRLDNVYREFLVGRDGNMADGSPSNEIGKRSTLG